MRPLFAYMGSKAPVRQELSRLMWSRRHDTYIELFTGSATVFYEKEKAKITVLNDLDPDVLGIHSAVAVDHAAVKVER